MEEHDRVVVLGGGVCGLYAARVLARAGIRVVLLEREPILGGLSGGYLRGANYYDFGVHMLHEFDKEIFEDIRSIMGEERIEVNLDAKVRWADSYYRYPLQFTDMIRGVNPLRVMYFLGGLVWAQVLSHIRPRPPRNAEEALIQLYGYPLYACFFREFTRRYWGLHPTCLSPLFIKSKMPRLSAVDAVKRGLARLGLNEQPRSAVESALLKETIHYSPTGAEGMVRCLAAAATGDGAMLVTGAEVVGVRVERGRAVAVGFLEQGARRELPCEECISTIPLPRLTRAIDPPLPAVVLEAADKLRFKALAVYGLLVRKPRAFDGLYIYFRDRIFHRVAEPKNAGLEVTPPDHTVLLVETTCEPGDEKWTGAGATLQQIFDDLEAEKICRREEIVETHLLRCETGYPIFSLGFEPHHERVMGQIAEIPNLQSTGRQGAFLYPNMHSAMRMGCDAARAVIARLGLAAT